MADNNNIKTLLKLPETLAPGHAIRIQGFVPKNANQFVINLQRGTGEYKDDVALHFSVRFREGVTIRNHLIGGKAWGREDSEGGIPIRRNEKFELVFTVEHKGFKVTANGDPFVTFIHRLPLAGIDHFKIQNDVDITLVTFEEGYNMHSCNLPVN